MRYLLGPKYILYSHMDPLGIAMGPKAPSKGCEGGLG